MLVLQVAVMDDNGKITELYRDADRETQSSNLRDLLDNARFHSALINFKVNTWNNRFTKQS